MPGIVRTGKLRSFCPAVSSKRQSVQAPVQQHRKSQNPDGGLRPSQLLMPFAGVLCSLCYFQGHGMAFALFCFPSAVQEMQNGDHFLLCMKTWRIHAGAHHPLLQKCYWASPEWQSRSRAEFPSLTGFFFLSSLRFYIGNQILTSEREARYKRPHGISKILKIFQQKVKGKKSCWEAASHRGGSMQIQLSAESSYLWVD